MSIHSQRPDDTNKSKRSTQFRVVIGGVGVATVLALMQCDSPDKQKIGPTGEKKEVAANTLSKPQGTSFGMSIISTNITAESIGIPQEIFKVLSNIPWEKLSEKVVCMSIDEKKALINALWRISGERFVWDNLALFKGLSVRDLFGEVPLSITSDEKNNWAQYLGENGYPIKEVATTLQLESLDTNLLKYHSLESFEATLRGELESLRTLNPRFSPASGGIDFEPLIPFIKKFGLENLYDEISSEIARREQFQKDNPRKPILIEVEPRDIGNGPSEGERQRMRNLFPEYKDNWTNVIEKLTITDLRFSKALSMLLSNEIIDHKTSVKINSFLETPSGKSYLESEASFSELQKLGNSPGIPLSYVIDRTMLPFTNDRAILDVALEFLSRNEISNRTITLLNNIIPFINYPSIEGLSESDLQIIRSIMINLSDTSDSSEPYNNLLLRIKMQIEYELIRRQKPPVITECKK